MKLKRYHWTICPFPLRPIPPQLHFFSLWKTFSISAWRAAVGREGKLENRCMNMCVLRHLWDAKASLGISLDPCPVQNILEWLTEGKALCHPVRPILVLAPWRVPSEALVTKWMNKITLAGSSSLSGEIWRAIVAWSLTLQFAIAFLLACCWCWRYRLWGLWDSGHGRSELLQGLLLWFRVSSSDINSPSVSSSEGIQASIKAEPRGTSFDLTMPPSSGSDFKLWKGAITKCCTQSSLTVGAPELFQNIGFFYRPWMAFVSVEATSSPVRFHILPWTPQDTHFTNTVIME